LIGDDVSCPVANNELDATGWIGGAFPTFVALPLGVEGGELIVITGLSLGASVVKLGEFPPELEGDPSPLNIPIIYCLASGGSEMVLSLFIFPSP
jgi:hypothetical protein